ncbi:hypothetical protein MELB17_09833 [Marinobacter sp. ELB17]|nr:hypothetical protein MELB17_09833 [Marinobacter sp. ELB17]
MLYDTEQPIGTHAMPPVYSHNRHAAFALVTAIVTASFSTTATANPDQDGGGLTNALVNAPNTLAWVEACNSNEYALARVHSTTVDEVARGLHILREAGEVSALGKMNAGEACLSIVASASTERPVISLQRSIETDIGIHEGIIRSNPRQAETMTLAYRLDDIKPSIYSRANADFSKIQEWQISDPEMAMSILNQGTAQIAQTQERSYTVYNAEATTCLVMVEPSPVIDEFLQLATPALAQGLSETERRWLTQYGDATEFWHEVSHCVDVPRAQGPDSPESTDSSDPQLATCGAAQSNKTLFNQLAGNQLVIEGALTGSVPANAEVQQQDPDSLEPFQPGYQPTAMDNEIFNKVKDSRILTELSYEALMDRQGLMITAARFGIPESGCTAKMVPEHPWNKLRALWSIGNPDIRYMSWLTPWLESHEQQVQRQVLADAWRGLLQAKKRVSGKLFYQDWFLSRLAEQRRNNKMYIPSMTPDSGRAQRWEGWLLDVTGQPESITSQLGKPAKL